MNDQALKTASKPAAIADDGHRNAGAATDAHAHETDGFQLVIDALKLNGIDTIFGLPGIPITDLTRKAQGAGMRVISFRHEQNAGYAASIAGFLTQKPGICLTVSAPGFLNGLTAESRWSEILSKPGMKAEFPFVGFESTFVALDSVCVDGPMLAIANPRLDTGVRTSAETFRAQAEAASAGAHAPPPGPQLAAATATDPPRQIALHYPVRVFKVIDRAPNPERIFLFEKFWPVPVCPGK